MNFKKFIKIPLKHNYYTCFLPEKIGLISSFILNKLFSGVKFNNTQQSIVQNLPDNAIVIYATKYRSTFEYLFSYTRYKQSGIHFPQIGFRYSFLVWQPVPRLFKIFMTHLSHICHNLSFQDPFTSGFIRQELINGKSAILPLIEKKEFYKRFVKAKMGYIHYLIEMQQEIDKPIYIVPQLMFFTKIPDRYNPNFFDILFGSKENPGKLRRLTTLFKNQGQVFVEFSKPLNLQDYLELPENRNLTVEQTAIALRHRLLNTINRHRQSITGPIRKTKHELKESILTNSRLQKLMSKYAVKHNLKIWEVHKKANACIDEIASKNSAGFLKIMSFMVKWLLKAMFEDIIVNEDMLAKMKERAKDGPLILVPCHKSHIDYLILSYMLLKYEMPAPYIAAGKNLSFWPMGLIFRSSGAFFVRRSFKGAVLYAKIFSEYIYKLLEEGCNIELFIEGGRSRTGKLLRPQLGLLSIIINAYKNGACNDLNIVPIFVGYDRVVEENAYLNEVEGGKKEPESFIQIIKAGKFLKKIYGKIYIHFDEPISLNEFTRQSRTSVKGMTSKEINIMCRSISHKILSSIDKSTVVTPHSLVATAILNCSEKMFTYEHIMSQIETYMNFLFLQKAKLSDTLTIDHVNAVEHVLDSYIQRKFINCISRDKKDRFIGAKLKVNENKRPALEFYKNNCIAFFIPAAFTALAILEEDSFQFSAVNLQARYSEFQVFFSNEFFYDMDKTSGYFVRKNLKAFIDDAILMPHPTLADTYNITSAGLRKLKLFARFLKTYLESYLIVINYFATESKDNFNAKDRMKKIQSTGKRMNKNREIELKEALSRVNYKNAVDFFIARGIRGTDKQIKIDYYSDRIQKSLTTISN